MGERYDIVLYGASGFVGRQTVAYLARHGDGLRWALAGRARERLEATRAAAGRAPRRPASWWLTPTTPPHWRRWQRRPVWC